MRMKSAVAVLVLTSLWMTTATASPIQVQITGMTDTSSGSDPSVPFTITLTYDQNNMIAAPPAPAGPSYFVGGTASMSVQVGGSTVFSKDGAFPISFTENLGPIPATGAPVPRVQISLGTTGPDDTHLLLTQYSLDQYTHPADGIPLTLPTIQQDFSSGKFTLVGPENQGSQTLVSGTITGLTVVPEPGYTTILCLVSGGVAFYRLRMRAARTSN